MRKQANQISLQDGSTAWLQLANNAGPFNNSIGPPLEVWRIEQKTTIPIYYDKGFWQIHPVHDVTDDNEALINDLLEKRNSLGNMLMELDVKPKLPPRTIPLDSDMSASRWAIGTMTVLLGEKYPAEEWFVHETNQTNLTDLIRSAQSRRFTLYCEEGAWFVWPPQVTEASGLAELGKKLTEKRNTVELV